MPEGPESMFINFIIQIFSYFLYQEFKNLDVPYINYTACLVN